MENFNMEAMKKKYDNESPDEAKKRKRWAAFSAFINLAVSIAMIVVGKVYEEDDQTEAATRFLVVGGAVLLTSSAVKFGAYLTPCKGDDKIADIVGPLADFAYFIVIIWGSVNVFGVYSEWTYEDEESDTYCPEVPFRMAFGILVAYWVIWPFMFCCTCMAGCCKMCAKVSPPSDRVENA